MLHLSSEFVWVLLPNALFTICIPTSSAYKSCSSLHSHLHGVRDVCPVAQVLESRVKSSTSSSSSRTRLKDRLENHANSLLDDPGIVHASAVGSLRPSNIKLRLRGSVLLLLPLPYASVMISATPSSSIVMEITSKVREIIKPSSPSPSAVVSLSPVDQTSSRMYAIFLLFFKEFASVSSVRLKESLSKVLSIYYPLAGRYRLLPNQALEIDCCDQGIEFYEALASKSMKEAIGNFYAFDPSCGSLVSCEVIPLEMTTIPLVSIQLTRFLCGGACLQVAIHHIAADATAISSFVKTWTLIASDKEDRVTRPQLQRSLLFDDNPKYSREKDWIPAEFLLEPKPFSAPKNVEQSVFAFTSTGIRSLLTTGCTATRFEILAAHLWIEITKARAAASSLGLEEETRLGFAVDGRKRLDPPVPDEYLGNVVFSAISSSSVRQLLECPIDHAVDLVQASKAKITDQHMRSTTAWIESREKIFYSLDFDRSDIFVSSWMRLAISSADFGSGRPEFVGTVVPWKGIGFLLPDMELDDRIGVAIAQDREIMAALRASPTFLV